MGERPGFEAFDCAPALRLEAHERVAELQFAAMTKRLDRMEALLAEVLPEARSAVADAV